MCVCVRVYEHKNTKHTHFQMVVSDILRIKGTQFSIYLGEQPVSDCISDQTCQNGLTQIRDRVPSVTDP